MILSASVNSSVTGLHSYLEVKANRIFFVFFHLLNVTLLRTSVKHITLNHSVEQE